MLSLPLQLIIMKYRFGDQKHSELTPLFHKLLETVNKCTAVSLFVILFPFQRYKSISLSLSRQRELPQRLSVPDPLSAGNLSPPVASEHQTKAFSTPQSPTLTLTRIKAQGSEKPLMQISENTSENCVTGRCLRNR